MGSPQQGNHHKSQDVGDGEPALLEAKKAPGVALVPLGIGGRAGCGLFENLQFISCGEYVHFSQIFGLPFSFCHSMCMVGEKKQWVFT